MSFGSAACTVAESDDSDTTNVTENTVEVTVTLSADPERTVVIPIEKTNQGGATAADYSGVPQNVTFDSGDTSKTFTFTAAHDTVDDDGESVRLSFGATLPTGVTAGPPATSAVTITDDDVPSVTVSFGSCVIHGHGGRLTDRHRHPRRRSPSTRWSSPSRPPTRAAHPTPTTPACPRA